MQVNFSLEKVCKENMWGVIYETTVTWNREKYEHRMSIASKNTTNIQ